LPHTDTDGKPKETRNHSDHIRQRATVYGPPEHSWEQDAAEKNANKAKLQVSLATSFNDQRKGITDIASNSGDYQIRGAHRRHEKNLCLGDRLTFLELTGKADRALLGRSATSSPMAICTTIAENLAIRRHVDTPSWVRRTVVRAIWRPNINIQVNELGGESRAMGVKVIL
jgi:hypothetical protein